MNGMVKFVAMAAVALACVSGAQAVDMVTVPVGNPGNGGEPSGGGGYGEIRICGAVDYFYDIGQYEVTAGQYAAFLNAVAATDTYGLYNSNMDSDSYGCQITQNGVSGSYTYDFSGGTVEVPGSTAANWADRPVNYVSWGDAARFANWLHNGQPTGAQGLTTTEDGSYYLNGDTTNAGLLGVMREPHVTWVIPSEDEWYKAAYHYNDGVTSNYYTFATSTDSTPGFVGNGEAVPDPDPGNYATWDADQGPKGIGPPYYRTEVGEHENSGSPYNTFDQAGNIYEWDEAVLNGLHRGLRGGSFMSVHNSDLAKGMRGYADYPTNESNYYGFRVADVSGECGNGVVEYGEACDDGNEEDTDFCLSTCQINPSIPAVSEWGVVVMTLLTLTAGTVVWARRSAAMV